ncbi:MAG: hypothetical protein U0794_07145 [Isosphaeraceae bacterium]
MINSAPPRPWSRRSVLAGLAGSAATLAGLLPVRARASMASLRLSTFSADVTIPMGHACMGGGIAPAARVRDPLLARGIVLTGSGKPVVICAVDWCEIRNEAYERWRTVLAEAAGTSPDHVLVSSIHQHDAPVADLRAEALLKAAGTSASVCNPEFHERAVQGVAAALRAGLAKSRPVTHVGTGKARVERVASNRRYLTPDGKPTFGRTSATRDPYAREQPEGTNDPWLRALSFWEGDQALASLNVYAVHPMSRYGQGVVSADFVGDARRRRQESDPAVFQMYLSGCSGNVTAGKYNDGEPERREALASQIHDAMLRAWNATERVPLTDYQFHSVPLRLEPRNDPGFTVDDLRKRLETDPRPFGRCLAAMGLSWRERADRGHTIDLPAVQLGPAIVLLMPGESYVEYQLLAQATWPDRFVVTLGYGECATGYVPTEIAVTEHDTNLGDWCWVAPGAEATIRQALGRLAREIR